MKNSINTKIVFDIIGTIKSSPEWVRETEQTPMLIEARNRLEQIINRVPGDLRDDLIEAVSAVEVAYTDMALLYGMRVANSMQDAISNPVAYSQYSLNVMLEIEDRAQLIDEGKRLA